MKPSGGVYFVHNSRGQELLALQEFVNGLTTASLVVFPIPDLPTLREEVTEAFQREAEKDLTNVVVEIQNLRQSRKGAVTIASVVKMRAMYDEVITKAGEHSRTLQCSQDRTAGAAEMALAALTALMADAMDAERVG